MRLVRTRDRTAIASGLAARQEPGAGGGACARRHREVPGANPGDPRGLRGGNAWGRCERPHAPVARLLRRHCRQRRNA